MSGLPLSQKKPAKFGLLKMAVAGSATLVLFACSSGSDTDSSTITNTGITSQFPSAVFDAGPDSLIVTGFDETNADATSPWLVNLRLFRLNSQLGETGDGDIDLVRYNDDFPVSTHVDFYTSELDVCEINDPNAPASGGGDGGDGPPPSISGGVTVTINSPAGPWFTFERDIVVGESFYATDNGLPAELLPAGATLSIPGDVFPAVVAHPLFDPPAAPERLLPDADAPITANSAYSWIPGTDKTRMEILLLAFEDDGSFVDFVVICDVVDDGAFTMPADVVEFVSTTPLQLEARYDRAYDRVDFVDGIVIRQLSAIGE